jgi:Tol biopolymer transport system component
MPQFSPDSRYMAYQSSESGRYEIYVQPFPEGAAKWPVSTNGGSQPRWSADGTELFYVEGSTLMAVAVSTEGSFTIGPPQRLFESEDLLARIINGVSYDVFPDGQRFVMIEPVVDSDEEATEPSIRIVENWYEEFRDREQ